MTSPNPHNAYIDIADACGVMGDAMRLAPERIDNARQAAKQMLLQGAFTRELFLYQFCESIPGVGRLALEAAGMDEDEFKQALERREIPPEVFFTKLAAMMQEKCAAFSRKRNRA